MTLLSLSPSALEGQLENEHEERTLLVREKHELERRVSDLQDRNVSHVDEDYIHKLKKELKKTKALLRDTQTMLEKSQSEGGQKLLVRQLKTQVGISGGGGGTAMLLLVYSSVGLSKVALVLLADYNRVCSQFHWSHSELVSIRLNITTRATNTSYSLINDHLTPSTAGRCRVCQDGCH